MNEPTETSTERHEYPRCGVFLNGKVQCVLAAYHGIVSSCEYDPTEIRAAFPQWDDAMVAEASGLPAQVSTGAVEGEVPELEAIRTRLTDSFYVCDCSDEPCVQVRADIGHLLTLLDGRVGSHASAEAVERAAKRIREMCEESVDMYVPDEDSIASIITEELNK